MQFLRLEQLVGMSTENAQNILEKMGNKVKVVEQGSRDTMEHRADRVILVVNEGKVVQAKAG